MLAGPQWSYPAGAAVSARRLTAQTARPYKHVLHRRFLYECDGGGAVARTPATRRRIITRKTELWSRSQAYLDDCCIMTNRAIWTPHPPRCFFMHIPKTAGM